MTFLKTMPATVKVICENCLHFLDSIMEHRIITKASRVQASEEDNSAFQVIVHHKREKKPRKEKEVDPENTNSKGKDPGNPGTSTFDIKRARHEVIRFGTSGLKKEDKKNAQIALAIKLGAKPPKGPVKSYKDFIAERKAAAVSVAAKDKDFSLVRPNSINPFGKGTNRKQKRMDEQDTIGGYGKVDGSLRKKKRT